MHNKLLIDNYQFQTFLPKRRTVKFSGKTFWKDELMSIKNQFDTSSEILIFNSELRDVLLDKKVIECTLFTKAHFRMGENFNNFFQELENAIQVTRINKKIQKI